MKARQVMARSAAVGVAITAVLGVNQGIAQASDYGYIYAYESDSADWTGPIVGTVRFTSDGDRVRVCDSRRDGRAVHVDVIDYYNHVFVNRVSARGGYGTCAEEDASDVNLREGTFYDFQGHRRGDPPFTVFYDEA